MLLMTMKMAPNKPNITMMLGKYSIDHIRMREVIYKLFKDLEGLLKHSYASPQNEIKEHFTNQNLKSKPYDKTLEQFTTDSVLIVEFELFVSYEGKIINYIHQVQLHLGTYRKAVKRNHN